MFNAEQKLENTNKLINDWDFKILLFTNFMFILCSTMIIMH